MEIIPEKNELNKNIMKSYFTMNKIRKQQKTWSTRGAHHLYSDLKKRKFSIAKMFHH